MCCQMRGVRLFVIVMMDGFFVPIASGLRMTVVLIISLYFFDFLLEDFLG
jgi:hypothetical protein